MYHASLLYRFAYVYSFRIRDNIAAVAYVRYVVYT